ncbi:hypothetical protein EWM64_g8347 [Hericium alpestre]|uniref:F-box domain-containing protein n=1 Tax=Hericium alpestre TaxID=135208 RepID=A0A4Y9ZM21_9AGAM|nr:hypothetical protein EWM64_g8347 [Hericium alpestre]
MHAEFEFVPFGAREIALLVSALRHLTSVTIRTPVPISVDLITILADLPKLRILQLAYMFTKPLELQFPLHPGLNFVALEEIELEDGQLHDYIRFFEALRGEHGIQRVDVNVKGCATRPAVARFIQAVSSKVSRDTLSQFHLRATQLCESHSHSSHASDNQTLFPLLRFRRMEHFSLTYCASAWDNRLLEDIALAWPALKSLDLSSHSGWAHTSNLTLGGLYPLAKHCPRLYYIHIVIAPFDGDTGRLPQRDWIQSAHQWPAEPMSIHIRMLSVDVHPGLLSYLQSIFPMQPAGHISFNDNGTILRTHMGFYKG